MSRENVDSAVVHDSGKQWQHYDQSHLDQTEARAQFDAYFAVFLSQKLPQDAVGMDVGCGSGRWALFVAPRVGKLHCIDPSPDSLEVAKTNLAGQANCEFYASDASHIPLPDRSRDFGYSLGVLHHIPDTAAALKYCTAKLEPGAPFLVYLYYRFDNRPAWFRAVWALSDMIRKLISRLPFKVKLLLTTSLAACGYWPLARSASLLTRCGWRAKHWPLSHPSEKSFYAMRTDALDRFGTRLEHRFTRNEIQSLMDEAGLSSVTFSDQEPYWCPVGFRRE